MLPGSSRVLDRATNTLVPCTPELCSDVVQRPNGPLYLNRAVYTGESISAMAVSRLSPSNNQVTSTVFLATMAINMDLAGRVSETSTLDYGLFGAAGYGMFYLMITYGSQWGQDNPQSAPLLGPQLILHVSLF